MQDLEDFYEEQWAPNASKATITIKTAVEQKQHTVLRMINCLNTLFRAAQNKQHQQQQKRSISYYFCFNSEMCV